MAFFAAVSSSIGKKLLLFGLRHIDILDKDPSDFTSVDVGKRTTLEIRDVGLHVKKLIALLHLKLPSEFHLSKARASLLRVTFVLDFGVPQIIIEIEGIQVHARLGHNEKPPQPRTQTRATSPFRRHGSPLPPDDGAASDTSSEADSGHLPTVDDLAQSFIREEPAEEIRELEEALNTQSEYLQESITSSEDGDDESVEGMGAGLGLPVMLRNILNTALDRLQIIATNVDIQVDDNIPSDPSNISTDHENPSSTVNFHMERVAIDSVTSQDPQISVTSSAIPAADPDSRLGKRRMRIDNVYARLISDAENFASLSRASRSASPVDTRSEVSSIPKSSSESSASRASTAHNESLSASVEDGFLTQASFTDLRDDVEPGSPQSPRGSTHLTSSILTSDEDRFADAASDDGIDHGMGPGSPSRFQHALAQREMNASSILYDDDGLLDHAGENDLFTSRLDRSSGDHSSPRQSGIWGGDGTNSSYEERHSASHNSTSTLDPASLLALNRSSDSLDPEEPLSHSRSSDRLEASTDNLDAARHHVFEERDHPNSSSRTSDPDQEEDLTESKLFTHDDAESMYMSAMSAAPLDSSHRPIVPGGWDSSSTSSQDTGSDTSAPVPSAMIASSILGPVPEADDGCETPRPGSRKSHISSPEEHSQGHNPQFLPDDSADPNNKVAKLFLAIDEVTVWFPLGLSEDGSNEQTGTPTASEVQGFQFPPTNLGEDSIFQDMPGSFSYYANSTASRRKGSIDVTEASKRRLNTKSSPVEKPLEASKKEVSAHISLEVGSVTGHIDLSTGRLMFQLIDRILKALTGETDPNKKLSKQGEHVQSQTTLELSVKHLGIAWLEHLLTESILGNGHPQARLEANPIDAIIKINLSSLHMASRMKAEESRAKLQIGKFVLSSLDQDILSFYQSRSRSRRSIGNLPEQLNHDIEIDFHDQKHRRVHIATRPVKVTFDMQKLDEALSSFGGFSGVLELGSSINSNNTLHTPTTPVIKPRPRGVHFGDAPAAAPPAAPPPTPLNSLKIQIHSGDLTFVLKGKSCALQLQTSPVKIAVRENNFRMKISEIQLSGPYTPSSHDGPPLIVETRDTTVTFLFTPEEADLTKLISMITPSKDPYENDGDILIDTLLRQRRKGSIIRAEVASVGLRMSDLGHLQTFEALGTEIARLSKVTKYLPDDDRPGILTLASIQNFDANVMVNERLGDVSISCQDCSAAHVGLPPLLALEIGGVSIRRGQEALIHEVVPLRPHDQLPMIMARMLGDEMEPVVKAKLFNVCIEYRVSTIMAALGLSDDGNADDIALGLASSVATITGATPPNTLSRQSSETSSSPGMNSKPFHVELLLRNCAIGLNPRKIPSKGLFVLTDARFTGTVTKKDELSTSVELRKASMHAIDDIGRLDNQPDVPSSPTPVSLGHRQLLELRESGFVSLSSISTATISVKVVGDGRERPQIVDVEFKNKLFVLESCADSTQTLIAILNGLQPPMPPSTAERYRTVVPLQQMMESFTGEVVSAQESESENFMDNADLVADEVPTNLEYVGSFYNPESIPTEEDLGDSMLSEEDLHALASPPVTRQRGEPSLLESFQERYEVTEGEEEFDFDDNYFKDSDSDHKGTARKWDSTKNQYELSNEFKTPDAPLKVRVRDMNIVWNLFDGYDWPRTRGIITQAVEDVEARAEERRRRSREQDEVDDFVEEDFLFNSVWVGIPVNDEKGTLAKKINHDIDDLVSETGSYATSTATRSTGATARPRSATKSRRRLLKLERSKHHKIAFQLSGVAVDLIVFPPGSGETQNSINVRVHDFEIYDHVPSSTWKKFATSLIAPDQREMGRPMINLELLTVKPVTELAASELVLRVTVLPLRLHVDQDALDFITRFFEFKDDSAPDSSAKTEQPFIQRVEVNTVKVKLDYKPKRVDYSGLRSGRTTEFMNFVTLDGADIILRHAILYGITSFDKLHNTLNDVWMPDVKKNQLPRVLSGLSAVRPIVNVGSGVRDLLVIPVREYKKDGRVVRSLQKGAFAFARNTTSELARLGAKVMIGTQNALEAAEGFLNPQSGSPRPSSSRHDWEDLDTSDTSEDEPRAVSNYAHQPIGVMAGLRGAARHLEKDLLTAKGAIIAIPAEVMEEGTGVGAAKAVARRVPTIIIRPMVGTTKAVGNALLGVGNALDKDSRRKIEDKYKSY
ncbi:hypothetical protein K469DRAFT_659289 [Zopfia rhizophila CBS 207.26]|uniref:Autophagy-related protein 2 n=1 Tax=Zopfia rhizophila CBS 207.26 TaxID=1314779 RepID=A0A6A6EBG5_9PEZI|nr:hypothetical protein K469DRAFT_659289 [Zopfia rhizophila CBS 207.26]